MTNGYAPHIATLCASASPTALATLTASEIVLPASGAPEWIELMRVGANVLGDGRGTFTLADAEVVAARSLADASGNILPIDRDHGMDIKGGEGTAYGWIDKLEVRDGALWGRVDWTEDGARLVASRSYRFISPTFHYRKTDNRILRVLRAAITNTPAITTMKLIASRETETEIPMDPALKALLEALGLAEGTDRKTALEKATASILASAATAAALKPILAAAKADELDETVATAIATKLTATGAAEPDPAKFVTIAAFNDVSTQLAALQTRVSGDAVETAVAGAKSSGKLSPAMEDWGRKLASSDMASFRDWEKTAPVLAAGQLAPPSDAATGTAALTADEKAVCASMGVTEEAFLATKQKKTEAAV